MRLLVVASALGLCLSGCLVDVDFAETTFQCGRDMICPDGYRCVGTGCRLDGTTVCGDGELEAGEECEAPFGDCCDPASCLLREAAFVCRSRTSECDVTEICDGAQAECPADSFAAENSACVAGTCGAGICVSPNLIAHWPFEGEGNLALDISGNRRDADILGPTRVPGRLGMALEFQGTGDYVLEPGGASYLNGLTALTLTMWVKSDVVDTDRGVFSAAETVGAGPDGVGLSLRYDKIGGQGGNDLQEVLKFGVDAGGRQQAESSASQQTTEWQFLAVTWASGVDVELFIDGVADTPSFLEPTLIGAITLVEDVRIGRGVKDFDTSWDGLIDDVRIYDRVLTAAEIAELASI